MATEINATHNISDPTPAQSGDKAYFGNRPFTYVPNKEYLKGIDKAVGVELGKKLSEENIIFSGHHNKDGTVTITYDGSNKDKVNELISSIPSPTLAQSEVEQIFSVPENAKETEVKEEEKEQTKDNKSKTKAEIFGNTLYYKIENKGYLKVASDVTKALIANLDAAGISYSGKINDNGTATLTFDRENLDKIKAIIKIAEKELKSPVYTKEKENLTQSQAKSSKKRNEPSL